MDKQLQEKRRKIWLEILHKDATLLELKEIKGQIIDQIEVLKKISILFDDLKPTDRTDDLIEKLDEIKQLTGKTEVIKLPEKLNIDWENAPKQVEIPKYPEKINIDWENAPEQKEIVIPEPKEKVKIDWENAPKQVEIPKKMNIDWENAPEQEKIEIPKPPEKVKIDWENAPKTEIPSLPEKIKVDWENAPKPEKMPVPKERIKIDWENMPKVDFPEKLNKSLQKIIPKSEMPNNVSMQLNPKDLWEKVSINYPDGRININIDRNKNDVVRGLVFSRE